MKMLTALVYENVVDTYSSMVNNMPQYDGLKWSNLRQACNDLGLDYEHTKTFMAQNNCDLTEYIRLNRYVVRGLIFSSIEAVAIYLGVDLDTLTLYMANGYRIDLAAHMIKRGLPIDYFSLPNDKAEKKVTTIKC